MSMSKWFLAVLVLLSCTHGVRAGVYSELGDAGDFLHPQDIIGSAITSIKGSIGGDDAVDAFRFFFGGGRLYVTAQYADPNDGWHILRIALFREDGARADPCPPTNPCLGGNGVIDFTHESLAAGNYVVGACYPPNPCIAVDPPFTIDFLIDPSTGQSAEIGAPVPEPASLVLLLSALMALVARRWIFDPWQRVHVPPRPSSGLRGPETAPCAVPAQCEAVSRCARTPAASGTRRTCRC